MFIIKGKSENEISKSKNYNLLKMNLDLFSAVLNFILFTVSVYHTYVYKIMMDTCYINCARVLANIISKRA